MFVIAFKKWSEDKATLLVTWDVKENAEISNFSTEANYYLINGVKTKAGYLMNGKTYLNLDEGLINNFFETEFIPDPNRWYWNI